MGNGAGMGCSRWKMTPEWEGAFESAREPKQLMFPSLSSLAYCPTCTPRITAGALCHLLVYKQDRNRVRALQACRRRPSGRSSSGGAAPRVCARGGHLSCSRSGWFSAQCGQTRAQNRPGSGMRDGGTRGHLMTWRTWRDWTSGGRTGVVKRTEMEARKGRHKVQILAPREILRITDFCTFPDRIPYNISQNQGHPRKF